MVETGEAQSLMNPVAVLVNYQAQVRDMIETLLRNNVIQPWRSSWAAPVLVIQKKDGKLRLCVDHWKLNLPPNWISFLCQPWRLIRCSGECEIFQYFGLGKGVLASRVGTQRSRKDHVCGFFRLVRVLHHDIWADECPRQSANVNEHQVGWIGSDKVHRIRCWRPGPQ